MNDIIKIGTTKKWSKLRINEKVIDILNDIIYDRYVFEKGT